MPSSAVNCCAVVIFFAVLVQYENDEHGIDTDLMCAILSGERQRGLINIVIFSMVHVSKQVPREMKTVQISGAIGLI